MKVSELIAELSAMPQDSEVGYIYDGGMRGTVDAVWLARSGRVAMADFGDVVYYKEDRPKWAVETKYWHVPEPFPKENP